jgi:hypothetical protein
VLLLERTVRHSLIVAEKGVVEVQAVQRDSKIARNLWLIDGLLDFRDLEDRGRAANLVRHDEQ